MVQLETGTKRKISHWVKYCAFELSGIPTKSHLNVFPLGVYEILLGMDWLYLHWMKVDCYDKIIECVDEQGTKRVLHGKKNPISVRLIMAIQAKHSSRKGCILFVEQVSKNEETDREIEYEEVEFP